MTIRIIQHEEKEAPGEYLLWARRKGHEVRITHCYKNEPLPSQADSDLLLVMGGWENPLTTKEECPYFDGPAEIRLIQEYIRKKKAVIGVCLGAQLLGEGSGHYYLHSPNREVGLFESRLTPAGMKDDLFASFPTVFPSGEWHADMPGIQSEAEILAYSTGCPRQIVTYGPLLYGFQCHLEFNREVVKGLIEAFPDDLMNPNNSPYIMKKMDFLAQNFSPMNSLLDDFLDGLEERIRHHA